MMQDGTTYDPTEENPWFFNARRAPWRAPGRVSEGPMFYVFDPRTILKVCQRRKGTEVFCTEGRRAMIQETKKDFIERMKEKHGEYKWMRRRRG